jgi:hypothetical protein
VDGLSAPSDRPWAEGVTEEQKEEARQLFYDGNKLLMDQFFKQAAEKYRQALKYWNHPAVHYNLSLALMNMEQPLELYEALDKAIEHGIYPLITQENFERAEKTRNMLAKQIGHVEIVCEAEGAKVTMDGKYLFTGPGTYKTVALGGEHAIAATKEGFISDSRQVVLSGGKHTRVELKLLTLADLTTEKRRFPRWLPWTVTASGVAAVAVGGALHVRARSNFQSFDSDFDATCVNGCPDENVPELADRLSGATWQQRMGIGLYALGGAAITTGLVLVFMNQPTTIRRELSEVRGPERVSFTPMLSPDGTGISASVRF